MTNTEERIKRIAIAFCRFVLVNEHKHIIGDNLMARWFSDFKNSNRRTQPYSYFKNVHGGYTIAKHVGTYNEVIKGTRSTQERAARWVKQLNAASKKENNRYGYTD